MIDGSENIKKQVNLNKKKPFEALICIEDKDLNKTFKYTFKGTNIFLSSKF